MNLIANLYQRQNVDNAYQSSCNPTENKNARSQT